MTWKAKKAADDRRGLHLSRGYQFDSATFHVSLSIWRVRQRPTALLHFSFLLAPKRDTSGWIAHFVANDEAVYTYKKHNPLPIFCSIFFSCFYCQDDDLLSNGNKTPFDHRRCDISGADRPTRHWLISRLGGTVWCANGAGRWFLFGAWNSKW
jgi:hypothetical protein